MRWTTSLVKKDRVPPLPNQQSPEPLSKIKKSTHIKNKSRHLRKHKSQGDMIDRSDFERMDFTRKRQGIACVNQLHHLKKRTGDATRNRVNIRCQLYNLNIRFLNQLG